MGELGPGGAQVPGDRVSRNSALSARASVCVCVCVCVCVFFAWVWRVEDRAPPRRLSLVCEVRAGVRRCTDSSFPLSVDVDVCAVCAPALGGPAVCHVWMMMMGK